MSADPRGPPPKGFRWCGADPECRARLMLSSPHQGCEHHRPRLSRSGPSGGSSPEARRRARRREISAGLAWEGV